MRLILRSDDVDYRSGCYRFVCVLISRRYMKSYFAILILIAVTWSLSAETIWTGNVAIGDIADFPMSSDSYQALSNTFPVGTKLRVINPKGGASTEVVVTNRLESPGVFIVIEERAAIAIGISLNQVMPIRVIPLTLEPENTYLSDSQDIASPIVDESVVADRELKADATPPLPPPITDDVAISDMTVENMLVDNLVVDKSESIDVPEPLAIEKAPVAEPMEPDVPDGGFYMHSVTNDEGGFGDEQDEGNIYFLTPADLQPPPALASSKTPLLAPPPAPKPPAPPTAPAPESPVPAPSVLPAPVAPKPPAATTFFPPVEDKSELPTPIYEVLPGDKRAYIQVGAYSSKSALEDAARWILANTPGYPLSMGIGSNAYGEVYKLLIGPLTQAERGVVLQYARSTYFADAFPYQP